MKLVFISDTHGKHRELKLPKGDILVHGGDYSNMGTLEELQDFVDWMNEQDFKYKIMVAGNHDAPFETDRRKALKIIDAFPHNLVYLEDLYVRLPGGITIYGTPWTPLFCDWHFMEKDESKEMKAHMDKIVKTDVLVSHGPAHGVLDKCDSGDNAGSKTLLKKVKELQPKYLLSGHIHEAYTEKPEFIGKTECWNGSQLDSKYRLKNSPIVIDLNVESDSEQWSCPFRPFRGPLIVSPL